MDSDSEDGGDYEQYSELDAFDADDIEVSPDDEQALAAFMVSIASIAECYRSTVADCERRSSSLGCRCSQTLLSWPSLAWTILLFFLVSFV